MKNPRKKNNQRGFAVVILKHYNVFVTILTEKE